MFTRLGSERGAAAVEFALVVPVLLLLLLGIIEFGRAYNTQIELSGAAREAARVMAVRNDATAAKAAAQAAAPSLNPALTTGQITIGLSNGSSCAANASTTYPVVTVTAAYPLKFLTGMFGSTITITGKSSMQCGG
ncbi:pilus assembly protein TadE [Tersicoccus sp. Bi-70]|nr:pilus assembly protein TadE [Tersicoccus sp. Bi-70]